MLATWVFLNRIPESALKWVRKVRIRLGKFTNRRASPATIVAYVRCAGKSVTTKAPHAVEVMISVQFGGLQRVLDHDFWTNWVTSEGIGS